MQTCIFNVERMLQNLFFVIRSIWHMAAGFCFATWMLSATPTPALISRPSSLGLFRPSDKNTGRYVISMQLVHEGDAWDLSSLSVDRPPIEPSQYVSVPLKNPDKMGFDEVRNLFCCHCLVFSCYLLLRGPGSPCSLASSCFPWKILSLPSQLFANHSSFGLKLLARRK